MLMSAILIFFLNRLNSKFGGNVCNNDIQKDIKHPFCDSCFYKCNPRIVWRSSGISICPALPRSQISPSMSPSSVIYSIISMCQTTAPSIELSRHEQLEATFFHKKVYIIYQSLLIFQSPMTR